MKVFVVTIAFILLFGCAGVQEPADRPESASETTKSTSVPVDAVESSDAAAEGTDFPADDSTDAADATETSGANEPEEDTTQEVVPAGGGPAETPVSGDGRTAGAAADDAASVSAAATPAATAEDSETSAAALDAVPDIAVSSEVATVDAQPRAAKTPDAISAEAAAIEIEIETAAATGTADDTEEPLPPPLPDPLDGSEINKLVFSQIGEGLLPVHRSGSAVYLLHDIDGNGYNDVFALALRVDRHEDAEFANINDYTRLYKAEREAARFYLRLFYQKNGTLIPADLVSLGERLVMDSFHPQAIVEGENMPFAVSIVFKTLQGRVREWVIFAGGKPDRFTMQERAGEIHRVKDIDSDGVIDVVMYEKVYEIGIGNETYLTWYRWNGAVFTSIATVNIVRNLRAFLQTAFELIMQEEWSAFSEHALSPAMRGTISEDVYSNFSVFQQVFTLAAVEESFQNRAIDPDESIRRAIFPEIRENPFSQQDSTGFFFPLSVRFKTDRGGNHLYTTRVYMLPNPFGEREFTFALGEG